MSGMGSQMVALQGQNKYSNMQQPVQVNQSPNFLQGGTHYMGQMAVPLEPLGIDVPTGGRTQAQNNPTGDPFLDLLS